MILRRLVVAVFASLAFTALASYSQAQEVVPLAKIAEAEAATPADMKPYIQTIFGTNIKFKMVPIPGGTYTMGTPDDEKDRRADEGPQHTVEIEPFWMGACEVTWEEYETWSFGLDIQRRKVLKLKKSQFDDVADALTRPTEPYTDMTFGMGKDRFPAICMTQLAAKHYTKWLSTKTGFHYRLPTEAEWEYACRAGTKTAYSFGDDPAQLGDYAWFKDNSEEKYQQVGQKKPNPWGLYDMHGNVMEWTLDQYDEKFYEKSKAAGDKHPFLSPTKLYSHVARGGSWNDGPENLRSGARTASSLDWKQQDPQIPQSNWYHTDALWLGFRVIRPFKAPGIDQQKAYYGSGNHTTEEEPKYPIP